MKLESDRGAEFYNSIFENFKNKNIHHYSRFTDKGPSIAEKFLSSTYIFIIKKDSVITKI